MGWEGKGAARQVGGGAGQKWEAGSGNDEIPFTVGNDRTESYSEGGGPGLLLNQVAWKSLKVREGKEPSPR